MHETIVQTIKDSPAGALVLRTDGVYNIFPKHIPDNSLTETFETAIVYDIVSATVTKTLTTYVFQLKVFARNYTAHRDLLLELKKEFNNKVYTESGQTSQGISTTVVNMVELGYEPDTNVYSSAIDIYVKTALDI